MISDPFISAETIRFVGSWDARKLRRQHHTHAARAHPYPAFHFYLSSIAVFWLEPVPRALSAIHWTFVFWRLRRPLPFPNFVDALAAPTAALGVSRAIRGDFAPDFQRFASIDTRTPPAVGGKNQFCFDGMSRR